jgi:hypothetical protein
MTLQIVSATSSAHTNKNKDKEPPHARLSQWQFQLVIMEGGHSTLGVLVCLSFKIGRGTKPSESWYSPKQSTIAKETKTNLRSVRRSIRRLVDIGLIQTTIDKRGRLLYQLATSASEADQWRAEARTAATTETKSQRTGQRKSPVLEHAGADNSSTQERTIQARGADNSSNRGGQFEQATEPERANINTEKPDTCEPKTAEKTAPYKHRRLTNETDSNNKQRFSKISKPHEPSSAAFVVVQNLSMSQETKPTAEPLSNDRDLRFGETKGSLETCIRQFGDARPIGSNFGADGEYQYWPEYENPKTLEAFTAEQVLGHYKLNAKLSHIAKALKEAQGQGIPTIELTAAIVWKLRNISPTQNGGLAWNMLDRNLVGIWNQWQQYTAAKLERAASKQRQAEQERKNEQPRQAEREHEANERIAQRMKRDAENERLAAIHAERMQEQAEHDAKPENIILRTRPELSQLENELEQVETKYQQRLAERAAKALEQESKLEQEANGTLWLKNPKGWEAMRSRIIKESRKNIPTEDAEHAQQIANITRAIAWARNTIAQAEKALAEAA